MNATQFTEHYATCFREGRTVGSEKEMLIIDRKTGHMSNISAKFQSANLGQNWKTQFDDVNTDLVVGFLGADGVITTDAGLGQIELISTPCESIHILEAQNKALLANLRPLLADNQAIMAHGNQPITTADWCLWVPKGRYKALRESTEGRVEGSCATSSYQTHVSVNAKEVVQAINVGNAAAGFLLALFGNGSVYAGKSNGLCAQRELVWDGFGPKFLDRIGLPAEPFFDLEHFIRHMFKMRFLFYQESQGVWKIPKKEACFGEFVQDMEDPNQVMAFWRFHEAVYWICARPRTYGTIEFRPCCPQPWPEIMAPDAATLGLIENLQEASEFLSQFSWKTLKEFRVNAAKDGLRSKIGSRDALPFVREFLEIVIKGLQKHGLGEENFLTHTQERVAANTPWSWADRAREIFQANGIKGMLTELEL